ncbi:hypothetical protein GZL_06974 [Streptomyces sp. 769]|nr:hypothetical protein GZL_06974 [Streptomyces sp. 769]
MAGLLRTRRESAAWGDGLTADQVTEGFVRLPEASPRSLAEQCRAFLWRETGLAPDAPTT